MNKEEAKMMVKSDEQILASEITGSLLKDWNKGKRFLAMSNRALLLFDPSSTLDSSSDSIVGKILEFQGLESRMNPDLKEECIIVFSDGSTLFRYNTGKSTEDALKSIDSSKIPLLSDIQLSDEWNQKLSGKSLWTRNSLWYDSIGQRKNGLKFVEVKILDVYPSVGDFPMKVKFSYHDNISYAFMNYTSDTADSRNFAALFFLTDPKNRYPNISDENWKLIQAGKVAIGMTKEECRLSIGYPDELQSGHNSSQTLDIWQYGDGTYLFFTDGLLNSFRQ